MHMQEDARAVKSFPEPAGSPEGLSVEMTNTALAASSAGLNAAVVMWLETEPWTALLTTRVV